MTNRPRWIIWTTATVLLWAAWGAFGYLPLRHRHQHEEATRSEWAARHQDMTNRIQKAPDVMARLGVLEAQMDSATQFLPQTPMLREYMDRLADLGRQSKISSVEVSPELVSMMSLTRSATGNATILDTLVVEFNATGRFHEIGTWLDQIESQSAFRHWRLARWDKGEEPGAVRFSGAAAFLVAVPRESAS